MGKEQKSNHAFANKKGNVLVVGTHKNRKRIAIKTLGITIVNKTVLFYGELLKTW